MAATCLAVNRRESPPLFRSPACGVVSARNIAIACRRVVCTLPHFTSGFLSGGHVERHSCVCSRRVRAFLSLSPLPRRRSVNSPSLLRVSGRPHTQLRQPLSLRISRSEGASNERDGPSSASADMRRPRLVLCNAQSFRRLIVQRQLVKLAGDTGACARMD